MSDTSNLDKSELGDFERNLKDLAQVLSDNPKMKDLLLKVMPEHEKNSELMSLLISLAEPNKK